MTYCVALRLDRGLVFAADTRTNAGVDNVAQYRKFHFWRVPGERVIVLLSAGNLAVTQSVVSILNEQLGSAEPETNSLFSVSSMYRAARLVGDAVREVRKTDGAALEMSKAGFTASFIVGGQIANERPRLFQIYAEGNFIEATDDTPFLQIGEHKYGKPILDRVARPDDAPRRGGEAGPAFVRFHSAIQPLGRHADRHLDLRARQPSRSVARSASDRTTNTSRNCHRPGPMRFARPSARSRSSRFDGQMRFAASRSLPTAHLNIARLGASTLAKGPDGPVARVI